MRHHYLVPSKLLFALALAAGLALPTGGFAAAQPDSKNATDADRKRISEALSRGDSAAAEKILQEVLAKKQVTPGTAAGAAPPGNPTFEEITACGFYPQETRLECVIDIKQAFGYGGGPLVGSIEYVLFCVDQPGFGLIPVGLVTLPMHDGPLPPWQYAVYRDFPPTDRLRTSLSGPAVLPRQRFPLPGRARSSPGRRCPRAAATRRSGATSRTSGSASTRSAEANRQADALAFPILQQAA